MISWKTKLLLCGAGMLPGGALLFYVEHNEEVAPAGIGWDIRSDGEFWRPKLFMAAGSVFLLFALISFLNDLGNSKQ